MRSAKLSITTSRKLTEEKELTNAGDHNQERRDFQERQDTVEYVPSFWDQLDARISNFEKDFAFLKG